MAGFTCYTTTTKRRKKRKTAKKARKGFPKKGCNKTRKFGGKTYRKLTCAKNKSQAKTRRNRSRFKRARVIKCKTKVGRRTWCVYVSGHKTKKRGKF